MSSITMYGLLYTVKQVNGQRIVEPLVESFNDPNFEEKEKKEIYFWNVPKHLTEIDLLRIFAAIGPIWRMRLLMNFSGETRGYGYLQYFSHKHYVEALEVLRGKEIIKGYRIFICKSLNKKKLLVSGIDPKYYDTISKSLTQIFPIQKVITTQKLTGGPGKLLLIFPNHRKAAISRRVLTGFLSSYGEKIFISWVNH